MYQLDLANYAQLIPLFQEPYLKFVIEAMIAGNTPSVVWVDNETMPQSVFIWDCYHCLYMAGNATNPNFNQSIANIIGEQILPNSYAHGRGVLKVYTVETVWQSLLSTFFPQLALQPRPRTLLRLETPLELSIAPTLPDGFQILPIDHTLLASTRPNVGEVIHEIEGCWVTVDRFLEHGIGYCTVIPAGEIVCWCTSEYVSPCQCGIGIETMEAHMNQGLATLTTYAFVQQATHLGWIVYWDSWTANLPSIKVAQKVGFQTIANYEVILVWL